MDPTACLRRILDALDDHDHEEASAAADDLLHWLDRGGFAPDLSFFHNKPHEKIISSIFCFGVRAGIETAARM